MIVTADAAGDFNATSQILRYSALAREVTVPRIPSTTSEYIAKAQEGRGRHDPPSGRSSPSGISKEEYEALLRDFAEHAERNDVLTIRLEEERQRRRTAEAAWGAAEQRMDDLEQAVREECADEFESRLEMERRRWKARWDEEADRNDEHIDRKLTLLEKQFESVEVYEDEVPEQDVGQSERIMELESENEQLKERVRSLERELQGRSPVKKQRVLKTRKWEQVEDDFENS